MDRRKNRGDLFLAISGRPEFWNFCLLKSSTTRPSFESRLDLTKYWMCAACCSFAELGHIKEFFMLNRQFTKHSARGLILSALALSLVACGSKGGNFSMLATSQSFHQADAKINNKLDILWVVDNSGSMDPLQARLNANFNSFMTNFQAKGFDYKIAVTSSDAYKASASYTNNPALARFRAGSNINSTAPRIITPDTPNVIQTFVTNATLGSYGSGDERVFQSMLDSMKSPLNTGFLRQGAFFAVVILSDEDDFSNYSRGEGANGDHSYTQTGLLPVDTVISELDTMTGSTAADRRYNVSAITVDTEACRAQHYQSTTAAIIGKRYIELAGKTNGVIGSVCDASFANSLNFIQQRIVELSTQFKLDREPKVETIVVTVNGDLVPNDATNGWTYSAETNAITFHGTAVPQASADLRIGFDPKNFL
jgi:hypothetical protein